MCCWVLLVCQWVLMFVRQCFIKCGVRIFYFILVFCLINQLLFGVKCCGLLLVMVSFILFFSMVVCLVNGQVMVKFFLVDENSLQVKVFCGLLQIIVFVICGLLVVGVVLSRLMLLIGCRLGIGCLSLKVCIVFFWLILVFLEIGGLMYQFFGCD